MAVASVLLIDDDPILRRTLAEILAETGYEVRAAASGAEGIALFDEHASDLVITDIYMPDMDGIELIRALRGRGVETPILAMSGKRGDAVSLTAARAFGASGVLRKPFRGSTLLAAIEACLESGAAAG